MDSLLPRRGTAGRGLEQGALKFRALLGPSLSIFKGSSASANLVPSGQKPDFWQGSQFTKEGLIGFLRIKYESEREIILMLG